ncbi:MAG: UDP-N-acetylglucosamine pyrophosphorylase [Clostridia bacterium]|nr:UDP-N-acetylglucosamine pyrophosphorylase [Clostridia bacterium]
MMNLRGIFDFDRTVSERLFESVDYPWEALDLLCEYIMRVGASLKKESYRQERAGIWIAKSAQVDEGAKLHGPMIIGEESRVDGSAYLRGGVIVGKECIIGNNSEIKNSVLFDGAEIPHYNYIGDSFIGYKVQLGMGAVISNLRADRREIICSLGAEKINSGRKRLGAIVGDYAQIGCSAIISPGTVISRNARIQPLTRVRGFVAEGSVYRGESIVADIL